MSMILLKKFEIDDESVVNSRRKLVFNQPYNRGLVQAVDMAMTWQTASTVYRVLGLSMTFGDRVVTSVKTVIGSQLTAYTTAIHDNMNIVRLLRRSSRLARLWFLYENFGLLFSLLLDKENPEKFDVSLKLNNSERFLVLIFKSLSDNFLPS